MLAEAMDQLSDDIGEDIEVDVLAWCCEYAHASDVNEAFEELQHYSEWGIERDEWSGLDADEKLDAIREFLHENTSLMVCEEGCIIWAAF